MTELTLVHCIFHIHRVTLVRQTDAHSKNGVLQELVQSQVGFNVLVVEKPIDRGNVRLCHRFTVHVPVLSGQRNDRLYQTVLSPNGLIVDVLFGQFAGTLNALVKLT